MIPVLNPYLDNGKRLWLVAKNNKTALELSSLRPATNTPLGSWRTTEDGYIGELSIEDLKAHDGNIAWITGATDLIIDVDVGENKQGEQSFAQLLQDLRDINPDINLTPVLNTPSGGQHYYLTIPDEYIGTDLRLDRARYPHIDLRYGGRGYVLIAGCKTEKGVYDWCDPLMMFSQVEAPIELVQMLASYTDDKAPTATPQAPVDKYDIANVAVVSSGWNRDTIWNIVDDISPACSRDDWLDVGMGIHSAMPTDDGLQIWEDWSIGKDRFGNVRYHTPENYKDGTTLSSWRSFGGHGKTMGSVCYIAEQHKDIMASNNVERILQMIKGATTEQKIRTEVVKDIKQYHFDPISQQVIIDSLQERLVQMTGGSKVAKSELKKMIKPDVRQAVKSDIKVYDDGSVVVDSVPEWCSEWRFIKDAGTLYSLTEHRTYDAQGFNMLCGRYVPAKESGDKPSAWKWVADNGYIEAVDCANYLPSTTDRIVSLGNGQQQEISVNMFNPLTMPLTAPNYTTGGGKAIEVLRQHFLNLVNTEENQFILEQWIAWQVQNMGYLRGWSPIIQGEEGIGKNFIEELFKSILGDKNVGLVTQDEIKSSFNSWGSGVAVNVVSELLMSGKSKYDAIERLKPHITDSRVRIVGKKENGVLRYNTTNYICFTNHKNAIPATQNSRRWWVIFSQMPSKEGMYDFCGETHHDYYKKLFAIPTHYGSELRKWFNDYQITNEFMEQTTAPATLALSKMAQTRLQSMPMYVEVNELLEAGGELYNMEVVHLGSLERDLYERFKDSAVRFDSGAVKYVMIEMGFTATEVQTRLKDGTKYRFWTKKDMSHNEIRNSLESGFLRMPELAGFSPE